MSSPRATRRRRASVTMLALCLVCVGALPGPVAASGSARMVPDAGVTDPTGVRVAPDHVATTLLIAGDIADCAVDADRRTAELVDSLPGIVMTAGDHVYPRGSRGAFRDCYAPTWGRFRERTWPVPGNHDWEVKGAAGYRAYFGDRAAPDGRTWYAIEVGSWRVYALDSDCWAVGGCGPRSPQVRWLTADLAAHPSACVLAVWHHPRFSSGHHGPNKGVAPFVQALTKAGAELVVNGHDHLYERFAPARADGTPDPMGVRSFVVGTGGAPLYRFERPFAPNSRVRIRAHGVLRLDLGADGYAWSFLGTDGRVRDAGTDTCH